MSPVFVSKCFLLDELLSSLPIMSESFWIHFQRSFSCPGLMTDSVVAKASLALICWADEISSHEAFKVERMGLKRPLPPPFPGALFSACRLSFWISFLSHQMLTSSSGTLIWEAYDKGVSSASSSSGWISSIMVASHAVNSTSSFSPGVVTKLCPEEDCTPASRKQQQQTTTKIYR